MSFAQNSLSQKSRFFIKYQPELKRVFGSSEAALIFQKSEYWSAKYPTGFWKFFEPCNHPLYKHGDSWAEELEISRKVFRRAFSAIGTHYKSKSEYLSQSDPFQGKLYVSYYDRKTNRTYFLRNHQRVQDFLSSVWQEVKKVVSKVKAKISCEGSYRSKPTGSSFVCALDISLQRSTSSHDVKYPSIVDIPIQTDVIVSNEIPIITPNQSLSSLPCDVKDVTAKPISKSLPSTTKAEDERDKNMAIAEEMLKIWNNITTNKQTLRSDLKVNLPQALSESFEGSLELWTEFCKTVASSKFLMGEAPNSKFKAFLAWLIKPNTVQVIQDKHYSLGDRQVSYHSTYIKPQPTFNRDEVQGTENWKDVCEKLSNKLGYATFKSWFKDLKFLHEESSQPILHCPTRFMRDWVQTHYQSDLERIVKQVLPHTTNLRIDIGL